MSEAENLREPVPDPDDDAETASQPPLPIPREVLDDATLDALNNADPDELIAPVQGEEARKGRAYESSAWLHSPAHLELLSMADSRLTRVANIKRIADDDPLVEQVDHVWARIVPGTMLVVIKAVPYKNLTALPVTRYKGESGAWVNLFPLLGPRGLRRTPGFRERFEVLFVPETSKLWPAIFFNLERPLERRREPIRKKKGQDGQSK